jgi:hypothetical protein
VVQDLQTHVTRVNGGVAGSLTVVVNDVKYLQVGDYLDFVTISGSSPSETVTRTASYKRIASIAVATKTLTLGSAITVSNGDYVYFCNELGYITTVADEPIYRMPYRCVELQKVEIKYSATDTYRPLRRSDAKRIGRGQVELWSVPSGSAGTGWPTDWYTLGLKQLGLWPAPSTAVDHGLRLTFARAPFPMLEQNDAPEIDVYYHDAMWAYAAFQLLKRDRDFEGAAALKADFDGYLLDAAIAGGLDPREPMTRGGS